MHHAADNLSNPFDITSIFKNEDSNIIKYIHYNGAETTIKTSPTCVSDEGEVLIDKGKAVLFISSSAGCTQKCRFCFLTSKKMPFCHLDTNTIIKSAIVALKQSKQQIKGKYLKISFMGMGDVFYSNTDINEVVKKVFLYAFNKKMIKGIDGVDIGTSYPNSAGQSIFDSIALLKETIYHLNMPFNPFYNYTKIGNQNEHERTPVRLFISLHSLKNDIRSYLMPMSSSLERIMADIKNIGIDIVFHYIMFDGINDSDQDINEILNFFKCDEMKHHELRILRYNDNANGLKESAKILKVIEVLKSSGINFKYQISTGSEILAACGQFICKDNY